MSTIYNPLRAQKRILGLFATLSIFVAQITSGQTTITTTGAGYDGSNNGGAPGAITFAVQNSGAAIILTGVGCYHSAVNSPATYTLWYNPTSLTGAPTISTATGWTQVTPSSAPISTTTAGITPVLTGLSVTIPAGATWRFALTSTQTIFYSGGTSTPAVNSFTASGVTLILYDNPISPGYAGTTPSPINTPRAFTGFITFTSAVPCAGKPTAGVINPITPCPNTNFNLTLANASTFGSGITFEWQSRVGTGPWTSVGFNATYTDNINTATDYRCIVTCTNASIPNNVDTTPVYTVQLSNFLYCYCIPTYASGGTADNIVNVQLGTLNNPSTGNNPPYYVDYSSQQPTPIPIPVLTLGTSDVVNVTFGTDPSQYCGVWIDYNRNGLFETTEYFTTGTNAGASGTLNIPINTPSNASIGITRMRIRGGDDVQNNSNQPCGPTNSTWGESEDYLVEIRYPPCTGPADAGIAHVTDTEMCPSFYFTLTDTTHSTNAFGLTTVWQESSTSGNIWNDVAGSANMDTITRMFSNTVWYRLRIVCANTGDTTYSNIVKVRIKLPYKCYCYSAAIGGMKDTSDIGAFSIGDFSNVTGGPHLHNPGATRGRTDYTDLGPIILYIDSTYKVSVFHTMITNTHGDARVTMFIDYNNNLLYDIPSESVYLTTDNPPVDWLSTANYFYMVNTITIPHAVIPDAPTGLRLILNNDLPYNVPSDKACGPYASGETEDYTVIFKLKPTTGVPVIKGLQQLLVYPNPNAGAFTVSFRATYMLKDLSITITDITGRTIEQKRFGDVNGDFKQSFDLGSQSKGMYFIQVMADGQRQTNKVLVR